MFSGVFIVDCICSLYQCFFRCFCFTTELTIVFLVFSFHQLCLPWLFFVRYFAFALLHRECYGLERAVFTLRRFLPYSLSQHLAQPAFIKASIGPAVQPRLQGLNLKFTLKVSAYEYFIKFGEQTKHNPLKAAVHETLLSRSFNVF